MASQKMGHSSLLRSRLILSAFHRCGSQSASQTRTAPRQTCVKMHFSQAKPGHTEGYLRFRTRQNSLVIGEARRHISSSTPRIQKSAAQSQSRIPPVLGGNSQSQSIFSRSPESQQSQTQLSRTRPVGPTHAVNTPGIEDTTRSKSPTPIFLFRESGFSLPRSLNERLNSEPRSFDDLYNAFDPVSSAASRENAQRSSSEWARQQKEAALDDDRARELRNYERRFENSDPQTLNEFFEHRKVLYFHFLKRYLTVKNLYFIILFSFVLSSVVAWKDSVWRGMTRRRGELEVSSTESRYVDDSEKDDQNAGELNR